jgi:lysozyme family protein
MATTNNRDDAVFAWAVGIVLVREGVIGDGDGFSDRSEDGLTRYGVAQRAWPQIDVRSLTREGAVAFYRKEFWDFLHCGEMPPPIAISLFDSAVNQGRAPAARMIQSVVRVAQDGAIGPHTLAAIRQQDPIECVAWFSTLRVLRYVLTRGWPTNGLGWTRRVFLIALFGFLTNPTDTPPPPST